MSNFMHRSQILLEPAQHKALVEIDQRENRSIPDVVREIVREWLNKRDQDAQLECELQALEELNKLRLKIQEKHGVCAGDLLEEAHAEREEDIERVW